MRYVILIASLFIVMGCNSQPIIPKPIIKHPKFPISNFTKSKPFITHPWVEQDSKGVYIVTKQNEWINETIDIRSLRSKYNLLVEEGIKFNLKIDELNNN